MTLDQRLEKARLSLLMDFPFFGQLALRLTAIVDPAIETAATDGREIRFNPDFCGNLSDPELTWLYAHEVSHPALGHLWRMGARNVEKYNQAADYVVNEMLESILVSQKGATHRMKQCRGALLDRKFYGLSVEQIYDLLPDPESGNNPGRAIGTFSKPEPGKPDGPAESAPPLEQEWKAAAAQAATVARTRGRGSLPGAIKDLLRQLYEPEVPWQDLLKQFVSRIVRDDYSFRRPNRRFAHTGIMLPTLRSEGMGTIAVAVDTSDSIRCNEKLLTHFLTELQDILDTTRPEALHLLDCDARVHSHTSLTAGDDLRGTRFRGGGGTCFRPVFEWLEENAITPDCLIYFTDLEGSFPDQEPAYPTLWLNYGSPRSKAPFGLTINVPKS